MKRLMTSRMAAVCLLSVALSACVKSSNIPSTSSAASIESAKAFVNTDGITLSAPQYLMISIPGTFALSAPAGVSVTSANWDFGDGTTAQGTSVSQALFTLGANTVTVNVTDSLGTQMTFTQTVNVIAFSELLSCIGDLSISAPAQASPGASLNMSVNIPSCLANVQTGVTWDFGDSSAAGSGASVSHSYTNAGDYTVHVTVSYNNGGTTGGFTLTTSLTVVAPTPPPAPTPTPMPDPQPVPTPMPDPQPAPQPQPEPLPCPLPAGALTGVTAISQSLIQIGGVYYMMDGTHLTFYTSTDPDGNCSNFAQVRTCNNGVLSGDDTHIYLLCRNGVPQPQPQPQPAPVPDPQPAPQPDPMPAPTPTPVYTWTASETYTACSADCGGTQSQIFQCKNSDGTLVDNSNCTGAAPVVTRACDGNPAAVASTVINTGDDVGSSNACPHGHLGVVENHRQSTTKTVYACVDHHVAVSSVTTTYGSWTVDAYCRTDSAYQCKQDNLSRSQIDGRNAWVAKCASQVPVIKLFYQEISGLGSNRYGNGVPFYPTFMVEGGHCGPMKSHGWDNNYGAPKGSLVRDCTVSGDDQAWVAPTDKNAPCVVPAGVYVAEMCVSHQDDNHGHGNSGGGDGGNSGSGGHGQCGGH